MQLPSDKIGILFVLVVLVVSAAISGDVFYKNIFSNLSQKKISSADLIIQRNTNNDQSVDEDNDGLMNWQESFYGSDPKNPDTDGDKTNDGDEIKSGRDPKIMGPNDKLLGINDLLDTEFKVEDFTPGSVTDNLSVKLLADYLVLKKNNNITEETKQSLVNNFISGAEQGDVGVKPFETKDLKTIASNKDSLLKYGVDLSTTYINNMKALEANASFEDEVYFQKMSEGYEKFAVNLISISVPDVGANVHLEIANRMRTNGVLFADLAKYKSDPAKSIIAVSNIQKFATGEYPLLNFLATYFKDNGIIFEDNQTKTFWNSFE